MKAKEETVLSASRIKTLETCSFSYWASYHLKIPQAPHPSTEMGSLCHLILELLLKPRHIKHFEVIMKRGSVEKAEAINRLILKHLNKSKLNTDEYREFVYEWLWTGLNAEFFGDKDFKAEPPEMEFLLENESPKYKIRGFIDKCFVSKDKIKIVDYKTSKRKFKGDDLSGNVQALAYVLAAKKKWPKIKSVLVQFLFLRFPRQPKQDLEFDTQELTGFEHYLEYMFKLINNFDEKMSVSNFAADDMDKKNLCQAKSGWRCPYLDAKDYYVSLNEEGEIIKSSLTELPAKEGLSVEKRHYDGCPRWKNAGQNATRSNGDFF